MSIFVSGYIRPIWDTIAREHAAIICVLHGGICENKQQDDSLANRALKKPVDNIQKHK
jgi:hypothetical protein